MNLEHVRLRQEAISRKKERRERQLVLEAQIKARRNSKWYPHPDGVMSDGMGRYFYNGEEIHPVGKLIGHSIEGYLCQE